MARLIYPLTESVLEKADLNAAIKVIKSTKITMGEKTKKIENYFKKKIVKMNALMVNSGSSANLLIFQCLINPMVKRLKPGDEVLVPSVTYVATYQAISASGAIPISCDVLRKNMFLDLEDAKKRLTNKTRVIMPMHYGGSSEEVQNIYDFANDNGLRVIEDAAHSFGSSRGNKMIGSEGDIIQVGNDFRQTVLYKVAI